MLLGALGVIGDLLAAQRTLSQRTFERVRRIELRARDQAVALRARQSRRRHRVRRIRLWLGRLRSRRLRRSWLRRSRGAGAGTVNASARIPRGSDSAYDRRPGRPDRQHVRQVRLDQPGRPPADVGLSAHARRTVRRGGARVGARCRLRRGRADRAVGSSASASGRVVGTDLEDPKLEAEWATRRRPNLQFEVMPVQSLSFADDEFDLVAATEVLEHVDHPEAAVAEMARVARRWLLVSVPHEPLWRALNVARGAYLRELGNTPGHLNHWTRARLRRDARRARRGRADAFAVPLDDAACPNLTTRTSARSRRAHGSCRSGSRRPGSSPSPIWRPPATSSPRATTG